MIHAPHYLVESKPIDLTHPRICVRVWKLSKLQRNSQKDLEEDYASEDSVMPNSNNGEIKQKAALARVWWSLGRTFRVARSTTAVEKKAKTENSSSQVVVGSHGCAINRDYEMITAEVFEAKLKNLVNIKNRCGESNPGLAGESRKS
ncbi:hypothetical protein L596_010737 [Steinernema carpocapsae]|uniref:Uncharacterized protein n=1 Tax=Steinernema carpocapsae TaxID=34508 RepID=A0A4U5PJ85_STECR|nr:hypothetical protein L596_010737 [Steinernema carpocapsae]